MITLTSGAILGTKPFIMCAIGWASAMLSKNPKVYFKKNPLQSPDTLHIIGDTSDKFDPINSIFSQRRLWPLAR